MGVDRTHGDLYAIDCPSCDRVIRDLWDSNVKLYAVVECDRCGAVSIVENWVVEITLRSKGGAAQSREGQ